MIKHDGTMNSTKEPKDKSSFTEEENSSKLIEAMNETIAEENARIEEFLELFNILGLEPKLMSKQTQEGWSKVEAILKAEGLPRVDEISLRIRMEQKKRESIRKAREERTLKSRYDKLCQQHSIIPKAQAKATESTQSLQMYLEKERGRIEEELANRSFETKKLDPIQQSVNTDHCPTKILEKYETYLKLVEKSNELDKELNKYGDLPANLSEARLKVEEKEKYLKDLEHAIFNKMQS